MTKNKELWELFASIKTFGCSLLETLLLISLVIKSLIVVKIMIFLVHAVHLSSKFVLDLYKLDIFQCFPVACCTWQYGRENSNGNAWGIQGPSSEQAALS